MLKITIDTEHLWDGTNKDLYDITYSQNSFILKLMNSLTMYFVNVTVVMGTQQRFVSSNKLTGDDIVLIDDTIESVIDSGKWLVYK